MKPKIPNVLTLIRSSTSSYSNLHYLHQNYQYIKPIYSMFSFSSAKLWQKSDSYKKNILKTNILFVHTFAQTYENGKKKVGRPPKRDLPTQII